MKMLYPRKMEEVLWHSATLRLPKSVLVKMPRLPTIRVIGSQFISTNWLAFLSSFLSSEVTVPIVVSPLFSLGLVGTWVVAGCQLGTRVAPRGLLIHCFVGDGPKSAD